MALKDGVALQPHQVEFVNKTLARDGNLLASHAVGTGKTLSSIAAFEGLRAAGKANRALVVVPAALRTNFLENGVKKFTDSKAALFGTSEEAKSGNARTFENPDPKADYHVISYEMFIKNPEKYIEAAKADTVIYDELHRVRNESSKTLEVVKRVRPLHRNFIGLTGSIVNNNPSDIVPLVDAMTNGAHKLGTKQTFETRFVSEPDKEGRRHLRNPVLLKMMLAPYTHHVDALGTDKMPAKRIEEVKVDMSPEQKELYQHVMGKLDPITALKLKYGTTKLKSSDVSNIFNKIIQARQVTNALHTINQSMSLSDSAKKSPKVRQMLNDAEDHLRETPDGQVILYSNLVKGGVDVISQGLKDRGIDHAIFVGRGQEGGSEKARESGVKEFQEGKKKVIVLSSAGKEGLDLRNTTFMATLDGHFNPEVIAQAEARGVRAGGQSHRAPEKRQVLIRRYVTTVPTSVTGMLAETAKLLSPAGMMDRLQNGVPVFYNPLKRERSTDEWIYEVARNKNSVNKELRQQLKTGGAPENDELDETVADTMEDAHDVLEDLLRDIDAGSEYPILDQYKEASVPNWKGLFSKGLLRKVARLPKSPSSVKIAAKPSPVKADDASTKSAIDRIDYQPFRYEKSDRYIRDAYLARYGNEVAMMMDPEKEELAEMADRIEEARFVDSLRRYYRETAKATSGIDGETRAKLFRKAFTVPTVIGAGSLALLAAAKPGVAFGRTLTDAALGSSIGAAPQLLLAGLAHRYAGPKFSTPKTVAKKSTRMTDEQLRSLLRGQVVRQEVVKKNDTFIK